MSRFGCEAVRASPRSVAFLVNVNLRHFTGAAASGTDFKRRYFDRLGIPQTLHQDDEQFDGSIHAADCWEPDVTTIDETTELERVLHTPLDRAVSPLQHLPYGVQLSVKRRRFERQFRRMSHVLQDLFSGQRILNSDGLLCPMEAVRPSPSIRQFRNKVEYVVGSDELGLAKAVGQLAWVPIRIHRGGTSAVFAVDLSTDRVLSSRPVFRQWALAFQHFIRNHSHWRQADVKQKTRFVDGLSRPFSFTGHYRQFRVRTTESGEVMVS